MRSSAALTWIALAACDVDAAEPAICTSGVVQVGTSENELMTPGQACNDCHAYTNAAASEPEAPIYAFAGTVYATAHEPDDCVGGPVASPDPAEVVVVSATGERHAAAVNRAGNFLFEGELVLPITARVVYQGRARWMIDPITTGDCNTCHSAAGTDGARGRIRLP